MKLSISTSIIINAQPAQVWEVFSNFENFPIWNPFILSLTGPVKEGAQIEIKLSDMNFKPIVLVYRKNEELRWVGKLLFKGLFDGEHYFKLIDNNDGTTTFEHGENFNGILVRPFKQKLMTETKAGFEKMNEALKEVVEHR